MTATLQHPPGRDRAPVATARLDLGSWRRRLPPAPCPRRAQPIPRLARGELAEVARGRARRYRHAVYFETDQAELTGDRAGPPAGLPAQRRSPAAATASASRATPTSAPPTSTISSWQRAAPRALRPSCANRASSSSSRDHARSARRVPAIAGRVRRHGSRTAGSRSCSSGYLVTLPPCPDWSRQSGTDFANLPHSNFGCATQTNLGLMIAEPEDLVRGRKLAPADGDPRSRGHRALPHRQGDRTPGRGARTVMATAIATAEQSDTDPQREQFLAFCRRLRHLRRGRPGGRRDDAAARLDPPGRRQGSGEISRPAPLAQAVADRSQQIRPAAVGHQRLADVCEPGVTVVALGDRNDCGLFRDLLQHGVADYLVKPITPGLLQKSVAAATEQSGAVKSKQQARQAGRGQRHPGRRRRDHGGDQRRMADRP